jgi:hypothetical protein
MFFSYDANVRSNVEAALSGDRLSVYQAAVGGSLERAIDLYCWNAAVGSAFFGPIGVLEVVLRNALDRQLSRAFSSPWYEDRTFLANDPKIEARIQAAKDEITKRRNTVTHPRMVAQLSFGFWVQLLRPGPNGAYVPAIWGPALSKAFPAGTKRSRVVAELDPLLKFRNRVAHHEPIFRSNPAAQYDSILRIIALVAPSLVRWVEHHSHVRTLIAHGPYPPHSIF